MEQWLSVNEYWSRLEKLPDPLGCGGTWDALVWL